MESFCRNFNGIFHVALVCRRTLHVVVVVVVYDFRFIAHYFLFVCLFEITIVCVCNQKKRDNELLVFVCDEDEHYL